MAQAQAANNPLRQPADVEADWQMNRRRAQGPEGNAKWTAAPHNASPEIDPKATIETDSSVILSDRILVGRFSDGTITMTLDDANKWLVAMANVGVLAGFVLVAYQLSLNTEAIRLQAEVDTDQQWLAGELVFMGETTHEAYALSMLDPGALTEGQIAQLWAYLNVGVGANLNLWRNYEAGFISLEELESSMELSMPGYVGYAFGHLYWNSVKRNYPKGFTDRVDSIVARHPNTAEEQYRAILDGARNLGSLREDS
jgi:hypothetical protein